jgi:hypothetical protein
MSEGLCYKCLDTLNALNNDISSLRNWMRGHLTCHHEPKEKPLCWCRQGLDRSFVDSGYQFVKIYYCPQCGRPLE